MPSGYLPIFIFLVIAILFPVVTIIAAKLIRPSAPFLTKLRMVVSNNAIKLRTRKGCCGNFGQPGC